ncbi:UNVERIFIED_CONTAM: Transposon Tf2-12 polyprotein [Sesamum radiatum]|uniref:Transposon Tf2-12 polyprotein n=1 Tax=Sesamum radiatum TaxID=300843 RepID=A0AAW2T722_SESRA
MCPIQHDATYQRLVNRMFKELIRSTMEVYVDDMLVKSKEEKDHLEHLEKAFSIMREFGMKLNPTKCTFGVRGGKFLGYLVSERGIEANSEKIEAIMRLPSPKTIKDVQILTGKIASLNEFIARSADRNLPFFKTLRHIKAFEWSEECEKALQELKVYLATPLLLANIAVRETLYVYLVLSKNAVSSVLVKDGEGDFIDELSGEPHEYNKGRRVYETREWSMVQYLKKVKEMMAKFDKYQIHQILREENERADALSKFGAAATEVKERKASVFVNEVPTIEEVVNVVEKKE